MEQLTPKQISQRKYYAANAEKLRALARDKYSQTVSGKVKAVRQPKPPKPKAPAQVKPVKAPEAITKSITKSTIELNGHRNKQHKFNVTINPDVEFKSRAEVNAAIAAKDKQRLAARRAAEDRRLARELGISLEDFQ